MSSVSSFLLKLLSLYKVLSYFACKVLVSLSVSELDLVVSWIPRGVNRAAHWVASFVSGALPQNWVSFVPDELSVGLEVGIQGKMRLGNGVFVEKMGKAYVVFVGRQPGVYDTWEEASNQVNGYQNQMHGGRGSFLKLSERAYWFTWKGNVWQSKPSGRKVVSVQLHEDGWISFYRQFLNLMNT
ncbi:hypothetical protein C3L33_23304, partial [Rhododendron williamsianum]